MKLIGILFFLFFPFSVFSAEVSDVRINEIAWMGTVVSGSDEWIELYNAGSGSVDLSGWSILSDDGSPNILLAGTIPAQGYFLIERTDDDSVPGILADLVVSFGNGISNTGEVLRLRNASGVVTDTVDGSSDWQNIGGDNVSKQTAQRSGSSWGTGEPTPRTQNVSVTTNEDAENENVQTTIATTTVTSTQTQVYTSTSKSVLSIYPRSELSVSASGDIRGYVGMELQFIGDVLGLYDEKLPYATLEWNFGDGTTASGRNVNHSYRYSGEYVVTLSAFHAGLTSSDRLVVFVKEPEVTVSEVVPGEKGYVELHNLSLRDLNLSGWVLQNQSGEFFVFPRGTLLLPGKKIKFSYRDTKVSAGASSEILLLFPNKEVAWTGSRTERVVLAETSEQKQPTLSPFPERVENRTEMKVVAEEKEKGVSQVSTEVDSGAQQATILWARESKRVGFAPDDLALLGGALLLVFGAGGILYRSHRGDPTEADEYTIIEDIIEGKEELR